MGTESATNALILVNGDYTLVTSLNCLCGADIHAIGILALVTYRWQMIEILSFTFDDQPGKSRIISSKQGKGTCKLADTASGAFVKICMDQSFDGILLIQV